MRKELLNGCVRLRITGESKERFLNMCRMKKIKMWNLKQEAGKRDELKTSSIVMCMGAKDLVECKSAIHKSGVKVDILEKKGLPFFLLHLKKRVVFAAGVLFCMLFLIVMMQKIWCIQIEGNRKVTTREMVTFLEENDIGIGCVISKIPYEELEFKIRDRFPDITWVSVVRKGTTLIVRIKENEFYNQMSVYDDHMDLIADYDGEIRSMVVRQGVPLVRVGDTVAKGDILIQGAVPVLDENARICKYQYCHAQADILIRTTIQYSETINRVHLVRSYQNEDTYYQLGIAGHKFQIGFGKPEGTCLVQEQVHQLVLFEYLYLPFFLNQVKITPYEETEAIYTEEEAEAILQNSLEKYLYDLSEKGVQIIQKNVRIIENGLTMQIVADVTVDRSVGVSTETTVELTEYGENND